MASQRRVLNGQLARDQTRKRKIANNRYGNSTALNNGSYDSAISSSPVSSISQSSDTSGVSSRESPQPVKYSASQIKQENYSKMGLTLMTQI